MPELTDTTNTDAILTAIGVFLLVIILIAGISQGSKS